MKIRLLIVLMMITLLFMFLMTVSAAGRREVNQDITPTPAPSKTPTSNPSTNPSEAVNSTPLPKFELPRAFTQDDLSVLTGNVQRPNGLAWHNGKLYTSCSGDWTVYEIDAATGSTAQYIYGVKNAHTMYVTGDGDRPSLWIPDFQNNTLTEIVQGNSVIVASNLKGPWGIARQDETHFLVTNLLGHSMLSISEDGQTRELIQGLKSPTGIAVQQEYVYIANTGSARRAIEWFNLDDVVDSDAALDSSAQELDKSLVTGLQNVTNITLGPDGYLYFSYALGTRGVVGRVDPAVCRENGGCSNDQVEIVLYSELAAPLAGLTLSADLRLYIHSIFSPDIYWVQLNETPSAP